MLAPAVLTHLEGIVVWQESAASFDRTDTGPIAVVYDIRCNKVEAIGMLGWKSVCGGLVEDVKGIVLAHRQSSESTPPKRCRDLHFGGASIPQTGPKRCQVIQVYFVRLLGNISSTQRSLDPAVSTICIWGITKDTELLGWQ